MAEHRPAGRRRNARGQGQALRAELVDAAARLLACLERPESLTLRLVAREVGVAPASVYGHFPDLGALLAEVLRLRYAEVAALLLTVEETAPPLEALARWCATFVRWGTRHPGEYRTLFGGRTPAGVDVQSSHAAGIELLDDLTRLLGAAVDPAVVPGRPVGGPDGLLLWTSLHGLVDAHLAHPGIAWPDLDDLVIGVVSLHTRRPWAEVAPLVTGHEDGGARGTGVPRD